MNDQLYVRPPFSGAVVRCPLTGQPLPPEGTWVEKSPHWLRQIKMGEVLQGTGEPYAYIVMDTSKAAEGMPEPSTAQAKPAANKPKAGKE